MKAYFVIYIFQSTSNPSSVSGPRAVAVYSYDATSPDDLSFQEGGTIKLLDKISEEWYKGEFDGQTGIFPVNFVMVIVSYMCEVIKQNESELNC